MHRRTRRSRIEQSKVIKRADFGEIGLLAVTRADFGEIGLLAVTSRLRRGRRGLQRARTIAGLL